MTTTSPVRIELPTGLPVGPVNVYLFPEPEPVLVDTGLKSAASLAALEAGLARHGLALADLARVVVSHHHVDHLGLAATIAARSKAEVWTLDVAREWIVNFDTLWLKRLAYYRDYLLDSLGLPPETSRPILDYMSTVQQVCDRVPAERVVTFHTGDMLSMGGTEWRALHTPGHASTLACFYQPDARLFLSTDMLLPQTPTPIVERPADGGGQRSSPLPQYLESLARIETLEIEHVLPGHGEPFGDHRRLIERQLARIEMRKQECFELVQGGCATPGEVLPIMYAHYPPGFRFTGLWMIVGYLDLLAAEGKVTAAEIDGVWRYRAHRD